MSLLRDGQSPYVLTAESVLIRTRLGATLHLMIGDADFKRAERIAATYEIIDAGEPVYGEWVQVDKGNRDVFGPHTCVHFTSRESIAWVEAP